MDSKAVMRAEAEQYGHYEQVPENEDPYTIDTPLTATEHVEARVVHPDAKAMFATCPWMRYIPVYGEACEAFGPKCTWSLGLSYVMCKGVADYLIRGGMYAMFMSRYQIEIMRYQRLAPLSSTGWSIKAFTAVLCDSFAFLGYTKRWYMLISCVAGAVFALVYGLLPAQPSSADVGAALVFLTCFTKANVDILSEGHYSRLMRRNPTAGPSLITWIWLFIILGALISSIINGPLADANMPQIATYISAPLQFLTGIFFVFNWYGEGTNREERAEDARRIHEEKAKERARIAALNADAEHGDSMINTEKELHPEKTFSDEEARQRGTLNDPLALDDELHMDQTVTKRKQCDMSDELILPEPIPCMCGAFEYNKEVVLRNWRVVVYSVVMTCAVIAMTCGNILADTLGLLIMCIVVSIVCCCVSFWALPPVIAKANVFGYLQTTLYISIAGGTAFFLAGEDCVPGGPHFSYTLLNTVGGIIGNICGLFGITIFRYVFSQSSYKMTFICTTIVSIVANIFDLCIINRWNVAIGIPDHAMYICGDTIVAQVIYMINFMPQIVLLSRLCPRGSESVVYALMAGFSNLGQSTSSSIGAIIMEYAWPIKSKVPCDFTNLPWLIITCGMGAPLLVIPLTFVLLPNARICDNIDVDGNVIHKEVKQEMKAEAKIKHEDREPQNDDDMQKTAA